VDKIVIAGDSLTIGFPAAEYEPGEYILNHGLYGDNLAAFTERFRTNIAPEKPDVLFILIGINNFALGNSPAEIHELYVKLLDAVKDLLPHTNVYMTSLLPTRDIENRPNEIIVSVNNDLQKLCSQRGIGYFNLHSSFCAEDGAIRPELTTDGLHLSEAGYILWRSKLLEKIREIRTKGHE